MPSERWADFAERWPDNDGTAHAVRRFLGVTAFGCNAFSATTGNALIVPHDESAYARKSCTSVESPTTLILVGGLPGRAYEPPAWSRDAPS